MDVKHKAKVFEKEDFETFLIRFTPNWLVRKSVAIPAYYGGLQRKECEELLLENFTWNANGVYITVKRAKTRYCIIYQYNIVHYILLQYIMFCYITGKTYRKLYFWFLD